VRLIALVLGGALLLTGCGTTEFVSDPPREPRKIEVDEPPAPNPASISIPIIDARSSLVPLGLTDTDCPAEPPCLQTPPVDQPMQAGWYAGKDPEFNGDEWQPGEPGPAVIAGHVDGIVNGEKGHPGIFARLGELKPDNEVFVELDNGVSLRFVVTRVGKYGKTAFPTEEVYGETGAPELRLITCGGAFDRSRGHYQDNIVVWAALA
jgi:hypothetical protein